MTPQQAAEPIALAWCGPDRHGISRLAARIAKSAVQHGFTGNVRFEPDPERLFDLIDALPQGISLLHLHVNDWLFSQGQGRGSQRLARFMTRLRHRGTNCAVTLHDLPHPADGVDLYSRRAAGYAEIVRHAAGVAVCSEHERALLDDALRLESGSPTPGLGPNTRVVPLPIDPFPDEPPGPAPPGDATVGVFGFVYPGKGHREVLDALAGLADPPRMVAIGAVSPGHDALLDELIAVGRSHGIRFEATGFLPEADVPRRLRRVAVPVAPNARVSASASINSWIAAGRRPLVPAGRYSQELADRLPGSVWIYRPGDLRSQLQRALACPEMTHLPAGLQPGPSTAEVAWQYLAWLRELQRTLAGG